MIRCLMMSLQSLFPSFTLPLPTLPWARDESCQPSRDVDDLHSPLEESLGEIYPLVMHWLCNGDLMGFNGILMVI